MTTQTMKTETMKPRALPAGTYYYVIEFPKGAIIVERTMIVVK